MYEGLHHVALIVKDIDQAKHFYGTVLGFQESPDRPDFNFPGAWYEIGTTQLHLIVHDAARTLRGTTSIDSRDGHFAVRVTDMEQVLARLDRQGVSYESRPRSITGWHQVFLTDPDGNIIEFNANIVHKP